MKGLDELLYYFLCMLLVMMFDVFVSSILYVCVWYRHIWEQILLEMLIWMY